MWIKQKQKTNIEKILRKYYDDLTTILAEGVSFLKKTNLKSLDRLVNKELWNKNDRKKFVRNILNTKGQSYKTFYGFNLRIFMK
jgi:hypothetical protein